MARKKKMSFRRCYNCMFFLLSVILAFILTRFETVHTFLHSLGDYGYIGIFLAGMMFVSTFTVAPGIAVLVLLTDSHPLWLISLIAGIGGVVGDLVLFRFVKFSLADELTFIYLKLGGRHLNRLFLSKYLVWTLPLIGALIIASPFPDEIGVSLMGVSKMKTHVFIMLTFVLDVLGVFLLLKTASLFY